MAKYLVIFLFVLIVNRSLLAQDSLNLTVPIEISAQSQGLSLDTISISRAQFLTYPGSFDDPSRLLMKHTGFSTQNDQANYIIKDGLPSHYVTWSIYGAEILNPNHLSSAGTITGRNSNTAGGVNMLSGQVLNELKFNHSGHDPISAISGIADLSFRSPYDNRIHANISLVGLETGIDRNSKDGKNNFLLNYRYSTVGLLTRIGLDFGDEEISYQDVTAKWHLQTTSEKSYTFYLVGGLDSNVHPPLADSLIQEFNDELDVVLSSRQLIIGVHILNNSHKCKRATTINVSINRLKGRKEIALASRMFQQDDLLISAFSELSRKWKSFGVAWGGTTYYRKFGDIDPKDYVSASPLISVDYQPANDWNIKATLKGEMNTLRSDLDLNLQSALSVFWQAPICEFRLNYRRESQLQSPTLLINNNYGFTIQKGNLNLENTVSDQFSVNINFQKFGFRFFYTHLDKVPGVENDNVVFSDLANQDYLPEMALSNVGKANIFGGSIVTNFQIRRLDVSGNMTISKSRQSIGNLKNLHLPYDFGHLSNLMLSRSFQISNNKYIHVSLSGHFRGGVWESLVSENTNDPINTTSYLPQNPYSNQLKSYFRSDLRINYVMKSDQSKYKSVISLDIQNITNHQNDAFHYYDPLTEEIKLQKQLGLIPILGWRIEF